MPWECLALISIPPMLGKYPHPHIVFGWERPVGSMLSVLTNMAVDLATQLRSWSIIFPLVEGLQSVFLRPSQVKKKKKKQRTNYTGVNQMLCMIRDSCELYLMHMIIIQNKYYYVTIFKMRNQRYKAVK